MPYMQKATNNYFGFQPIQSPGGVIQCNPYLVSSSEGGAIYIGDVVCQTSIGTVRAITGAYTATSSMATAGVSASYIPANGGSTAALLTAVSSQTCLVYDKPDQLFAACDTTSGVVGPQTGLFKNYRILATGCVGTTGPNGSLLRSVMAISGVTATADGAFKPMYLHPVESGLFSSAAAAATATGAGVRKFIGQFVNTITQQSSALNAIQNTTS